MIYFIVYLFLEVMLFTAIAGEIGGLLTFTEIIFSAIIGLLIMKNFKSKVHYNLKSLADGEISKEDFIKLHIFIGIGAGLLIIPGFLTDIIGVLLQFEFFGLFVAKRFLKSKRDIKKDKYKGDTDVIDVEVVEKTNNINYKPTSSK